MPPGKKKKNGRGGARPGAGRTKGPPTIYHGLRLPPEVSRWLKNIVKAWNKTNWGIEINVDKQLSEANPNDYDALILPGGVMNPDKLRQNKEAVAFAFSFLKDGKPIAAICHGPQLLIETGLINGRTMTSYPSLQTDLRNAGVRWVDQEVVVDNGLVTSRTPADLEAFNQKMIEEIREGAHHHA